jgi:hypothetical protein
MQSIGSQPVDQTAYYIGPRGGDSSASATATRDRARRVAHLRRGGSLSQEDTETLREVVAKGEIPKHYLTERGILFSRKELDEWLMER